MDTPDAPSSAAPGPRHPDGTPGLRHPDGTPVRVLVVDDEPDLAGSSRPAYCAPRAGRSASQATGGTALSTGHDFRPDAVVLDVMLPDIDGLQVAAGAARGPAPGVCVLFLTARDAVEDRIAGITAGGDDYVTKPFSLEEVLARLRGLLRRAGMTRTTDDHEAAGLRRPRDGRGRP